jgi:hypothetical protein
MKKHVELLLLGFILFAAGCSGNKDIEIGEELNFKGNNVIVEKGILCVKLYPVNLKTAIEGVFFLKREKNCWL